METKTTCCIEQNVREVMERCMQDRKGCDLEWRGLSVHFCHYLFVDGYQEVLVAQLSHQSKYGSDQMPSESFLMMQ